MKNGCISPSYVLETIPLRAGKLNGFSRVFSYFLLSSSISARDMPLPITESWYSPMKGVSLARRTRIFFAPRFDDDPVAVPCHCRVRYLAACAGRRRSALRERGVLLHPGHRLLAVWRHERRLHRIGAAVRLYGVRVFPRFPGAALKVLSSATFPPFRSSSSISEGRFFALIRRASIFISTSSVTSLWPIALSPHR